MKKTEMKKILPFCGLLVCAVPGVGMAGQGFYLGLNAGATFTNDGDFSNGTNSGEVGMDTTANFAGAIGYQGHPNVRGEIEVSYRQADIEDITVNGTTAAVSGDLDTLTVLANVYYDFTTGGPFRPYISSGLGVARHDIQIDGATDDDDTVFAYQAGLGASYDISPMTALTLGYRFLGSSDPDYSGTEVEYDAHEIRGGVRFHF